MQREMVTSRVTHHDPLAIDFIVQNIKLNLFAEHVPTCQKPRCYKCSSNTCPIYWGIGDWKMKFPFGMSYFQVLCLFQGGHPLPSVPPTVARCHQRSDSTTRSPYLNSRFSRKTCSSKGSAVPARIVKA